MMRSVFAMASGGGAVRLRLGGVLAFWLLVGVAPAVAAVPAADGLYATFQIQRAGIAVGEFTARLEFEKTPRTAANFVGLAEGSRPWIDGQRGLRVQRPFYDGITFHRVVAGFVIQAGSPNGQGTDGPGYTFRDEFHAELRHGKAGILSMANSGLHSNGSQFFITLNATAHLDDVHSVFGEVIEGMNVVSAVQPGDVIQSLTITRNGAAAQAFDVHAQGLPAVVTAEPQLQKLPAGFQLNYPLSSHAEFFAFHSDDLKIWLPLAGGELYGSAPATRSRDVSALTIGKTRKFFSAAKVQYPDPVAPASVTGKKLTLNDQGGFALAFSMSGSATGNYSFTGASQVDGLSINSYTWSQELAYRGRFSANIYTANGVWLGDYLLDQANISLGFSSATGGNYRGNLINQIGQALAVEGTFTVADL
jgi:cyclophilin family peptidyl-prolyl cis-trans isomerase